MQILSNLFITILLLTVAPLSAQSKWQIPDNFKDLSSYVKVLFFRR